MGFKQYRSEPLTEPEKRYLRKKNGVKQRFARDNRVENAKPSDDPKFIAPYTIKKISKSRRFNGCRLNDETRLELERRKVLRADFFAGLRG